MGQSGSSAKDPSFQNSNKGLSSSLKKHVKPRHTVDETSSRKGKRADKHMDKLSPLSKNKGGSEIKAVSPSQSTRKEFHEDEKTVIGSIKGQHEITSSDNGNQTARDAYNKTGDDSSREKMGTKQSRKSDTELLVTQREGRPSINNKETLDLLTDARSKTTKFNVNDFNFYRTVGTGSFGRVRVVKNKNDGKFFAVKILNKEKIVKSKQVAHINAERAILAFCDSPFIVKIHGTSQDKTSIFMFLEYISGGEMFTYIRRYKKFPSPVAKFYAAEVLLAIKYLHSHDIIYRDLKPENLLIASDGHIKLTDLGFAKHVPDITWTLCGTPDYLAPEIIQSKGYGKSVDWYSLGVLIFEMIAGYPPFYEQDHRKLYERILANRFQWPSQFDPIAADIVRHLVTPDLSKRYGNLRNGITDIVSHPWFQEVNWEKLECKSIAPPIVPRAKKEGDTSNFDSYPEHHDDYGEPCDDANAALIFPDF